VSCLTDEQIAILNELKNYLPGMRKGQLPEDIELGDVINSICRNKDVHVPIVSPGRAQFVGGTAPTEDAKGNLVYLKMTVNTDQAYRILKIPYNFNANNGASFHVHWTKSQDTDQSGNQVKWRIHYTVFDGKSVDASGAGATVEYEDTYDDNGTTTRVVYRTDNLPVSGLVAGYYVALRVEAVTPSGGALTEPGLVSVDFIYEMDPTV
jgi:hypothetical protein